MRTCLLKVHYVGVRGAENLVLPEQAPPLARRARHPHQQFAVRTDHPSMMPVLRSKSGLPGPAAASPDTGRLADAVSAAGTYAAIAQGQMSVAVC